MPKAPLATTVEGVSVKFGRRGNFSQGSKGFFLKVRIDRNFKKV